MASEYRRLLDVVTISGAKSQESNMVMDAGAYRQLNVQFIVLAKGAETSNDFKLTLQHASVNEEDAFIDVKDVDGNTVQVDIANTGSTGNFYFHVEGYLRYLRWTVTDGGSVTTAAIAGVDVVVKE